MTGQTLLRKVMIGIGTLLSLAMVAAYFIGGARPLLAATITSTATGGPWATGSTWTGGVAPASTDSVVIATTGANAVTISAAATCAGLTINSGATLSYTAGVFNITGSLINNGTLNSTVASGPFLTSTAGTMSGTGTTNLLSIGTNGNYTVNSAVTITTHLYLGCQSGTGTLTLTTGANVNVGALDVGASSTATNAGTVTMASGATLTVGTLQIGRSTATPGSINMNTGGTLKISGSTVTITNTTGTWTPGTGTVEYSGAGQTLPATYFTTYNNLTTSGSGTKTLGAAVTISGNLTVGSGTTLDLSTFTANRSAAGGTLSVAATGTLKIGGTNTFPTNYSTHTLDTASTVEYSGTAQTVSVEAYGNFTISGSGIKTLAGTTTISGTLALTAGTLTVGGNTLTIAGNSVTRSTGGIDASNASATVAFTNTGGLSLPASTFSANVNNLTINSAGGVTLGSATTIAGTLALTSGTLTVGGNTLTIAGNSVTRSSGGIDASNASATVAFTNTGGLSLPASTFSANVNNLTINGAGGVALGSATIVAGTLTLTSGALGVGTNTLTLNGTVTATSGSITSSAAGTVIYGSGSAQTILAANYGNLTSSGAGARTLASSGTIGIAGTFTPGTNSYTITGSTVNYNATGGQSVAAFLYNNLTLSGSGAKTIGTASGTLASGTLTINVNATASVTNTNIGVTNLSFAGVQQLHGSWGYGPGNPPQYHDTTYFANTTGYLNVSSGSVGPLDHFVLTLASPQTDGVAFTGANTLTAQDIGNNTVSSFNASIDNVTITAVTPLTGTISGLSGGNKLTSAADFSSGVANLTTLGLKYTGNVSGGTFTATSASGKTGTSGSVTINIGVLDHFALVLASPQTNGVAFTGTNTLTAQDIGNNTLSSFNASTNNVTIAAVTPLTGTISGLSGGNKLTGVGDFSSGVANLTTLGLKYTGNANGGTFTATSATGSKTGTSGSVTINVGGLDHFAFTLASPQVDGVVFTGTNNLTAQDIGNNTITTFDASANNVTISTALSGTISGLSGGNKLTGAGDFSSGVANITTLGMKYTGTTGSGTFTATSATGSKIGTSGSVTINIGATTRLVITGTGTQTAGVSQNLTIYAEDVGGNTVTGFAGAKNLTFSGANSSANPVTAPTVKNSTGTAIAFGSSTTISFTSGVATVSGGNNGVMTLYKAETANISAADPADSISASSGSDALSVTVSTASMNKFAFSLTNPQTNGVVLTGANTLTAEDNYGNVVSTFNASTNNVTIAAVTPLTGTISGLSGGNKLTNAADFSSGVANLTTLGLKYTGNANSGTFTATAASGGYTGTSGSVTINIGPLDHFVLTLASPQTDGVAFTGTNTLTAQDIGNNTVTGFNASIDNVTIAAVTPLTGTISGLSGGSKLTGAADFTSGVANLTTLGLKYTGNVSGGTFTATSASGKTGTSGSVTINIGVLDHFALVLASPQTDGVAFTGTNTLTAQDIGNNTLSSFNASTNNVTIAAVTPLTGTISGLSGGNKLTGVGDFSSGVANLTTLGLKYTGNANGGTFTATSATGSKTGTSGSVTINVGGLDHFAFTLASPQVDGVVFTGTNNLTAQDIGNNTITTFDASANNVTISTALSGTISGLSGGNKLTGAGDFSSGVANITTLGMKYTGTTGSGTFTATSATGSKIGTSGSVTINVGSVSAGTSTVNALPASVVADGSTNSTVTVTLLDAGSNPVSGKTVTLAKTSGLGTPTISAASGPSSVAGVVTFTVKSTTAASDVFTATDTTDSSLVITATATVNFTAGAVNAGTSTVVANPTSVPDDGATISTITVTLLDVNHNPVSGKTVTLAAGSGHSIILTISGTSNSSGVATFTVTDHSYVESVTYTATDTTDTRVITQTATVSYVAASITLSPPGGVSLSLLNAPATAQQIVGSGSAGSVTAGGLGAGSYSVTVSGSPTNLTNGVNVLANPLLIATGNTSAQIGNITSAAGVTSGNYSATDAGYFTAVTGSSQTIGTGITAASFVLNLYAYQEINALEAHRAGTYTLTITYTATASF